jgi:magnesium transporter
MIIDCAVYQDGKRRPGELALHEAYEAATGENTLVWIGLYEPDEAEFDSVRREFNLHELAVEDAIHAQAAAPLADPLDRLVDSQVPGLDGELGDYFRDIQDHLMRVVDEVSGFRELLTSVLQANLTQVALRQNEVGMQQNADMRRISAWVAIVAVPTMIAGIYGMNFQHMPELTWTFGYPLALAVMATACVVLYRFFRGNGWL